MPPKSAVEKSEHRNEIDDLLLDGKSPRFVSEYLWNEYKEKISHTAINNYRNKHLNVIQEGVIEYHNKKSKEAKQIQQSKDSKKKKKAAVKKVSSDLEKLDLIIEDALDTNIDIERLEGDPTVDQARVEDLKLKKRGQGITAIKTKSDILKHDDTINVNIENNLDLSKSFNESKMRDILNAKQNRNSGNTE